MSRDVAGDDPIAWALRLPLESTRQIGHLSMRLVLVALANHADADGYAWPSTRTLEQEIAGMNRRDIRNALAALTAAGAIANAGVVHRSSRYQLAGYPAHSLEGDGREAPPIAWAGGWAGGWAGYRAGYPAPNRKEGTSTRAPAPARTRGKPPWCGRCDRDTRLVEDSEHTPSRCPNCHPHRPAATPMPVPA